MSHVFLPFSPTFASRLDCYSPCSLSSGFSVAHLSLGHPSLQNPRFPSHAVIFSTSATPPTNEAFQAKQQTLTTDPLVRRSSCSPIQANLLLCHPLIAHQQRFQFFFSKTLILAFPSRTNQALRLTYSLWQVYPSLSLVSTYSTVSMLPPSSRTRAAAYGGP